MEFNEDLITRAHELAGKAEAGELSLPAEIEGFPGFYVASASDAMIRTVAAFVSKASISYKIGTPRD